MTAVQFPRSFTSAPDGSKRWTVDFSLKMAISRALAWDRRLV
jgi:hypothetical protein